MNPTQIQGLLETVALSVVSHPESVTVREMPSANDHEVHFHVLVDKADMGRMIGRNGQTIKAIRTLVQVAGKQIGKRVKINIEEF
ncbi:MAG: KH domain-containing protein [Culicoidibacterales bacterium]